MGAVNIEKAREKARNRVHRVGIELEGGWKKVPDATRLAHDGSVRFNETDIAGGVREIGELPSPPLELESMGAWVKKFYPQFVNATCGMHVHMSFLTALTYQRLMDPRYGETIIAYIAEWAKREGFDKKHCIWSRLEGKSEYCKHVFAADQQVRATAKDHDRNRPGNRYTVIHYPYSRLKTLECRLLPMMRDSDQAIRAINEIIGITNAFLVATAGREEKLRSSFEDDGAESRDNLVIRV